MGDIYKASTHKQLDQENRIVKVKSITSLNCNLFKTSVRYKYDCVQSAKNLV